jgi:hypothetical protein
MPVRPEALRLQTPHSPFREVTILKTATGKHNPVLTGVFGDRNNAFR